MTRRLAETRPDGADLDGPLVMKSATNSSAMPRNSFVKCGDAGNCPIGR